MKQVLKLQSKRTLLSILFVGILALSSCKITLIPDYNEAIAKQIDNTAMSVDKFYLTMLETTTASGGERSFNNYARQYVDIEVELSSLLNKNKIRPLNENSVRICEITLQLWRKYKEEHKTKNSISNGIIKLNQKTFSDLFYAMQVAEKGKSIVNKPPQ